MIGGDFNDLWRYDPLVNQWYFINGNTTNVMYITLLMETVIQDLDMGILFQHYQMIRSYLIPPISKTISLNPGVSSHLRKIQTNTKESCTL